MNGLQLSSDLNVITAEINSYKQVAGQAIFEIGRRLKHVKENDLVHGEFGKWLESIDMNWNIANRFMKIATELNYDTYQNIGWQAMYLIATLPPEEREKEHTLSSGETKTVDEMTVRELQEVKRQLKETEQAKQQAEQQAKQLEQELQAERDKEPKVIETTVEKVIDRTDYKKIEQLNNEINTLKQSLNRAVSQQDYEKLKRELEKKDDELLALTQSQLKAKDHQLIYSNASYLARDVGKWVNKLRMDIHERADIEGDKEVQRTLNACIKTLEEAIKEMQEWTNIKTERGVVDAEYTVIT